MIPLSVSQLSEITFGKIVGNPQVVLTHLFIDSREYVADKQSSVFLALRGKNHNAHDFISNVYSVGLRCFIVSHEFENEVNWFENATFLIVENTLDALQNIAAYVRNQYKGVVIGITGSNGKTIVKEWLNFLLRDEFNIVRSPKSYNSQVGVALSLLLLDNRFDMALIEAGISEPGEMERLKKMIRPDFGVFTGIGHAHDENFENTNQKLSEKFKLFSCSLKIFLSTLHENIANSISYEINLKELFSISDKETSQIILIRSELNAKFTEILFQHKNIKYRVQIPFTDTASFHNALTCIAFVAFFSKNTKLVFDKFKTLPPVEMRLEIRQGINGCRIINDAYSADLGALEIALDVLHKQLNFNKKTIILSDIFESGFSEPELYNAVANLLERNKISYVYGIGKAISRHKYLFSRFTKSAFFLTTKSFLDSVLQSDFNHELILLKGAREFKFEQIADFLQLSKHSTRMEINMSAMLHNLDYYRNLVNSNTKILVMVKAFSYGSGLGEIALFLQHHRVDYLGVAFSDEGVRLRKAGVTLPIIVMNPDSENLADIFKFNLECEVYNVRILNKIIQTSEDFYQDVVNIHIKFDSGMSRLGFQTDDISELKSILNRHPRLRITSVFSHLAGTDEPHLDEFTHLQVSRFRHFYETLTSDMNQKPMRHILNSSGIERFPEYQFEMVRLGIGLYGFSATNADKLKNIATLKSTISQIKTINSTETVGYSRKGKLLKNSKIAIIPIGYADGYNRALSNGKGRVLIGGKLVPVIGNISMDMFMADISDTEAAEGDEVVIFGDAYTAKNLADTLGTIPYEILTGISQRVKRVYYY